MVKITVQIEGMQCGMCEAHINDALRDAFPLKKVTASHSRKEAVMLTEQDLDEEKIKNVIDRTGYTFISCVKEPYEKKGMFSFLKK